MRIGVTTVGFSTNEFKFRMEEKRYAVLGNNLRFHILDKYTGSKIRKEVDFQVMESLIKGSFANRFQ